MSGSEYAPPSGSVFRHRRTGKTKIVRYGTGCGVHWTGEYGGWRYECWERWNSWIKNAEDITPNGPRERRDASAPSACSQKGCKE